MSSNCLSLNPSETEFLIFGLPQLSKLDNPTIHLPNNVILSPVDSARKLGVIFDKNVSFSQHFFGLERERRAVNAAIALCHKCHNCHTTR